MKKYILPLIAFGALTFGIVSMVKSQPKLEATVPPSPPPVSPFDHTVAADGLVESSSENISIGTPIADVVSEVPVVVGQRVRAGDVLFKLDDRQLEAELAVRKAELDVAQTQVTVDTASYDDVKQQLDFAESLSDKRAISSEELSKRTHAVDVARAKLEESRAQVAAATAEAGSVQTQIDRSTIRAPIDGEVLQCKVHLGEFAPAGVTETPLILLGSLKPLNIRVDVDENEAWRVQPDARAVATVRGNANLKTQLTFVRFEPFVLPKKSLTGDSTERVDTRVLQVIYRVEKDKLPLFVGQQMDVFIDAPAPEEQAAR
ncbi:MAG TPA: HlyD family efflux transporter periplasmic adaptor subunit [Verrucomicrobiae bacterium]|jgi:multidrug efflux pump subunit AcrA (membrane-fusion protein)|nr:HlyD family efflux transporter periplasmic adaptor subunit [Verrucomicrobiae bacterium]